MSSISVGNLSNPARELNQQIRQAYTKGAENVENLGNAVKSAQNSSQPGTASHIISGKGMNIDIYG